jgi:hypothetical protein
MDADLFDDADLFAPVVCRQCGCTDDSPCMTPDGACSWAEDDLCSACVAFPNLFAAGFVLT